MIAASQACSVDSPLRRNNIFPEALLLAMLTFLALSSWAGEDGKRQRVVNGKVLDADGKPSAGTTVYLVRMNRYRPVRLEESQKRYQGWHWTTDAEGEFVAVFAKKRSPFDPGEGPPGWDEYHFVIPPGEGHCGAVSERFLNPETDSPSLPPYESEWGLRRVLKDEPIEVVLRLTQGISVDGGVTDPQGRPVPDAAIHLWYDLHLASHTGYGGEILQQETRTGPDGSFHFPKVYPVDFALGVSPRDDVWVRTRLGENPEWTEDVIDRIEVEQDTEQVHIEIGVSDERYRVWGTISDPEGRPVPEAKVSVAVSRHRSVQDWADTHAFIDGKTAADGSYEMVLRRPWIRFIRVDKEGYQPVLEGNGNRSDTLLPGRYDFRLERSPSAGESQKR